MSRRLAFTLLELLVVVAIIAILLALLMPSLGGARRQARTVVCLANLMTIGSGMKMYQADHRGWLPVGPADKLSYRDKEYNDYLEPGPGRRPFPWSNCHWGGRRAAFIHHYPIFGEPKPETQPRMLTQLLYKGAGLDGPTPLFECPADQGSDRYDNPFGHAPLYFICGNSYYIFPWHARPQKASRIKNTSAVVLVAEGTVSFDVFSRRQSRGWHGRFSTHNLLFLDFHAENRYIDTRKFYGPGWQIENYFDIMDYYAF